MNLPVLATELALCGLIVVLLVADLLRRAGSAHGLWKFACGGLLIVAAIWWSQRAWIGQVFDATISAAGPTFVLDRFAHTVKGLCLLTVFIVMLMTRHFTRTHRVPIGEFYLLLCSALLGMLVIASARDFLLLFIAIELLTFSLYVMAAYLRTDPRSVEAGLKYLIVGSISSGFLVYGISMLYGAAGGTNFTLIHHLASIGPMPTLGAVGMLLVLAALGFKIAMVPFHLWAPDVYEGAPTPVVALLSVGSKMAGMVALVRVFDEAFLPAHARWGMLVAVLSAATMLYGNLSAIPQTNVKRLLGYSSIGHAGYLLMGLSTGTMAGAEAIGIYLVAYLFSNLAVFFVVVIASSATGSDALESYNGLSRRSPLLAAVMFVGLLSLAGVPPLAGFVGKLFVLLAVTHTNQLWLVAIGAVTVAISLYYYLMIVRRMYMLAPASAEPIAVDGLTRAALWFLVAGILLIGIVQEPFLQFIASAFVL